MSQAGHIVRCGMGHVAVLHNSSGRHETQRISGQQLAQGRTRSWSAMLCMQQLHQIAADEGDVVMVEEMEV